MSEEEMTSLLRALKEQLNRMEARQIQMDERQRLIKQEVNEQPVQGSFASTDQ